MHHPDTGPAALSGTWRAVLFDLDGTLLDTAPDFVQALQLESHLSPTRSNGLSSMLRAIRGFAAEAAA